MAGPKILYICQEISPFLPESEMASLCRSLPQAMQEQQCEVRIFMPRFGCINERRNQLHEVIRLSGMNLIIDDNDHALIIKVASIQSARMQIYFIDNEDFFHRKGLVSDAEGCEYTDNDQRSIFFVRGVLETVRKLRWVPDVIHCHGWMSSLALFYLKTAYADDPFFKNAKLVYSFYNDGFTQPFGEEFKNMLPMDGVSGDDLQRYESPTTYAQLMKGSIALCDGLIQGGTAMDPEVRQMALDSGKPFMEGNADNRYAGYLDFYTQLLSQK